MADARLKTPTLWLPLPLKHTMRWPLQAQNLGGLIW
jgi:hypothetical protein